MKAGVVDSLGIGQVIRFDYKDLYDFLRNAGWLLVVT